MKEEQKNKIIETTRTRIKLKCLKDEELKALYKEDPREFILVVLSQRGVLLRDAPDFKNDKEVVLTAVKSSAHAIKYASDELRKDREVLLVVAEGDYKALNIIPSEFKEDKEIALAAVKSDYRALKILTRFVFDIDIINAIIAQKGGREFLINDIYDYGETQLNEILNKEQ